MSASKSKIWSRDGFLISTSPSLFPMTTLSTILSSTSPLHQSLSRPTLAKITHQSICFGLYSPTSNSLPTSDPEQGEGMSESDSGPSFTNTNTNPADVKGESLAEVIHEIATHVKPSPSPSPSSLSKPATQERRNTNDDDDDDDDKEKQNLIGLLRLHPSPGTFCVLSDFYIAPEWRGQGLGRWLFECVREVLADQTDDVVGNRMVLVDCGGVGERVKKRDLEGEEGAAEDVVELCRDVLGFGVVGDGEGGNRGGVVVLEKMSMR